MRLQQDSLTKIKNYIHAAQAFVILLSWILTIAVYVTSGSTDGRTSWFFALCWLSIPILIYLVATPMWSRTARFTNVYASATLDGLSVILWLSAWAAVASYVSAGKNKGTNTKGSGCENFGLGSAAKCKLSEATIIFGVIVMLLFVATSYISVQAVMHYRRTGQMPASARPANDFAAQTQDAFSSNLRTDDFDDEAGFDARQGGGHQSGLGISKQDEDEYALLHQADNEDLSHPPPGHGTLPVPYGNGGSGLQSYNTSYGGASGRHSPNSLQETDYGGPPPTYGR